MAIRADGTLWRYTSAANGTLAAGVQVGRGWAHYSPVFVPGDQSNDGRLDLIGRNVDGTLRLYPSTSTGWFQTPRVVMADANKFRLMA